MKETCYWCGASATSKEHVPPRCLFPEAKDVKGIYNKSFREQLITVPSCDMHNMQKTTDDQYLLLCLAGKVGNNSLAYVQNATKGQRTIARKPNIYKVEAESVLKINGMEYPVQFINADMRRLRSSFESIVRGIYFYEFKSCFRGTCMILSDFMRISGEFGKVSIQEMFEELKKEFENYKVESKGANPEVFLYQVGPKDVLGTRVLKLTFYKNTVIYAVLKESERMPDFLSMMLEITDKTTITMSNGMQIEIDNQRNSSSDK